MISRSLADREPRLIHVRHDGAGSREQRHMRANVTVRLKAGVLDPQGEAVRQALGSLGFAGVKGVRIAKLVELELEGDDATRVKADVERMADALLANPVIESWSVDVVEDGGGRG